ncbi:acyltransferase [Serratia marcescens]|uniref:acyltransferase family protein n=1 Tax=Serratia TaxID=613 RepID=UPI00146DB842|nr:acyltransferase [Serratia marcescens]
MISIQLLRAIAALAVVLYHVGRKSDFLAITNGNYFEVGKYGVDLFFIISGFIMAYITHGKKVNFITFMKKRFVRIIPIYWVLTSVALAVFIISPSSVNSTMAPPGVINSYLLFPVEGKSMLLEVAWTLRYEFIFYIIFSLSILTPNRYVTVSVLLGVIWVCSKFSYENYYVGFFFTHYMGEFLLGVLSFLFYTKGKSLTLVVSSSVAALVGYFYGTHDGVLTYGLYSTVLFNVFVMLEDKIKRNESMVRPLTYLGDASYSIYLAHLFIIAAAGILYKQTEFMSDPILFNVSTLVASVLFSVLFYEFVEKIITRKLTASKHAAPSVG